MPRIGRYVSSSTVTGVALAAAMTVALAATVIEQRQALMEENGDAMDPLAAIAKGEAPFDAAVVQSSAETIVENLSEARDLFPEGSHEGDTRALPEIWQQPEEFQQSFDETIDAARNLAQVSAEAEFLPALGAVGDGCKGCHEDFRRPEDD